VLTSKGMLANATYSSSIGARDHSQRISCVRSNFTRSWICLKFRSLRHGAASALLEDGATPAVVQRQLRHSDTRITLGIYGHVIGGEQRSVVQNRSARLVQ
jgi:integrase